MSERRISSWISHNVIWKLRARRFGNKSKRFSSILSGSFANNSSSFCWNGCTGGGDKIFEASESSPKDALSCHFFWEGCSRIRLEILGKSSSGFFREEFILVARRSESKAERFWRILPGSSPLKKIQLFLLKRTICSISACCLLHIGSKNWGPFTNVGKRCGLCYKGLSRPFQFSHSQPHNASPLVQTCAKPFYWTV